MSNKPKVKYKTLYYEYKHKEKNSLNQMYYIFK